MRAAVVYLVAALACLMLSACGVETNSSEDDRVLAEKARNAIVAGDEQALRALLAQSLLSELNPSGLAQLRAQLPREGIKTARMVRGVQNVSSYAAANAAELEYEVSDGRSYSIVRTAIGDQSEGRKILAINTSKLPASIDQISGFPLTDKSLTHYVALAGAILCPLVCLAALIFIVRARTFRRRWLWGLGSALGFGQFSINWFTGQTSMNLLAVQLLGAGILKAPDPTAPWILSFGLPVVAILFFVLRPDLTMPRPLT